MEWIIHCDPEVVLSGVFALLGAVIGVAGSLSTVFLTKAVQKHGEITLHARIVGSRIDAAHRTWGYIQTNKGVSFHIPLWLDICNTSNVSKIVRNVNLCTIKNSRIICSPRREKRIPETPQSRINTMFLRLCPFLWLRYKNLF